MATARGHIQVRETDVSSLGFVYEGGRLLGSIGRWADGTCYAAWFDTASYSVQYGPARQSETQVIQDLRNVARGIPPAA